MGTNSINSFIYSINMEELSIIDLYKLSRKLHPEESIEKTIEGVLSLWTMGLFDSWESEQAQKAINNIKKQLQEKGIIEGGNTLCK